MVDGQRLLDHNKKNLPQLCIYLEKSLKPLFWKIAIKDFFQEGLPFVGVKYLMSAVTRITMYLNLSFKWKCKK